MILLMSEYTDNSTLYVSRWLLHWNIPFIRIDGAEKYILEQVTLANGKRDIVLKNSQDQSKLIKMSEIRSVWYRRGEVNFVMPEISFVEYPMLQKAIEIYLEAENMTLEYYFYHLIADKPHIGTFFSRTVNKLHVLYEALNLGIKTPNTVVTTQAKLVQNLKPSNIISKALYEGFKFNFQGGKYTNYTEQIDTDTLHANFFPTLFQENIEKEADIRVFYLCGKFYSMAIRSQSDEQTKTDFRKYIKGIGNRSFPFQLPLELEGKLDRLMKKLGLETGSLDLIFTKKGEFIFLEVNPVGQFGMTSIPCNYMLERRIAHRLKELANN